MLSHLPRGRWFACGGLAASLLSGLATARLIGLVNESIDGHARTALSASTEFLGLILVVVTARMLSQLSFTHLSQSSLASIRLELSKRIASAPFSHVERHGAAKGLAVLTEDANLLAQLFLFLPAIVLNAAIVLGCLIYLGYLSSQVLLAALTTIAIGSYVYHLAYSRALRHLRASRVEEDAALKHFRALFEGAKELRLHRQRRAAFLDRILSRSLETVRAERTAGLNVHLAGATWGTFLSFGFIWFVLFVLGPALELSTAVRSGCALIFLYMLVPLEALLQAVPHVARSFVSLERIEQMIGTLGEGAQARDSGITAGAVQLRSLTHRYFRDCEDGAFQLGPIDLTLAPGELVFLVGSNGSGKTTLAKVLVGLYFPEQGEILLNNERVTSENIEEYRQNFSAVFSDFFLFDDLLGIPESALTGQANELLQRLGLAHKLSIEAGTFSTLDLSSGQRKRLALLVALLEDRPFYVFDEWAADQDPTFREIFYMELIPKLKARGKGVLVISHDDRYYHVADRCLRLEFGRLQQQPISYTGSCSENSVAPRSEQRRITVTTEPS